MSNAAAWLVPSSWAMAVATAGVWSRWLTVATITQSICCRRRCRPCRAPRGPRRRSSSGRSRGASAQRRSMMPERCLDPLVARVDRLDDVGVGDDACGPVAADAEDGGVPAPLAVADRRSSSSRFRGGDGRGAGRGDRVAVLDEPLDDGAAVRSDDRVLSAQAGDLADGDAGRQVATPAGSVGAGGRCPWRGRHEHPPGRRGAPIGRRARRACRRTRGRRRAGRGSSARTSRRPSSRAWRCRSGCLPAASRGCR